MHSHIQILTYVHMCICICENIRTPHMHASKSNEGLKELRRLFEVSLVASKYVIAHMEESEELCKNF